MSSVVNFDVPPGYLWQNRPDYNQTYNGVDLVLTKRLANKWMMRGSFTFNDNKQHVGPGGCVDPTNVVPGQSADTGSPQTGYTGATCADGSIVATRSTTSTRTTSSAISRPGSRTPP